MSCKNDSLTQLILSLLYVESASESNFMFSKTVSPQVVRNLLDRLIKAVPPLSRKAIVPEARTGGN